MSSPTSPRRPRTFRPTPDVLEERQLMARMLSGTDIDGDIWTLKLTGPGDLRVTTQPDASGNDTTLTAPALINTITITGANPDETRLIGTVKKGSSGDGRVYFQNLTELGRTFRDSESGSIGNGLKSIDMPNFWLGDTQQTAALTAADSPTISVPDGVNSLRFGGVDTTVYFGTNPSFAPAADNVASTYSVQLGTPNAVGTTIIIDRSISNGQAAASGSSTTTPTQDGVIFSVVGRINLFQANEIDGNTAFPSTGFQGGGGTLVASVPDTTNSVVGATSLVRVGGNATNFAVQSGSTTGGVGVGGQIQSYFVGGETNNVQVLSTGPIRNATFGRGMDTVTIAADRIQSLSANRGALNSYVATNREIGHIRFGGDVVSTKVLSGYVLGLVNEFTNQTPPTTNPTAVDGGRMTVFVAGNVANSVFAASTEPGSDGFFGAPDDLVAGSHIRAKVEGAIDNSNSTVVEPTSDTAFFAKTVKLTTGPVIPPSDAEAPYGVPTLPRQSIGLHGNGTRREAEGFQSNAVAAARAARVAAAKAARTVTTTASVPNGPMTSVSK